MSCCTAEKLLIFDLDNTLFDTKSIDENCFDYFSVIKPLLIKKYGDLLTTQIQQDFWKYPLDYLIKKYRIDYTIKSAYIHLLNQNNFNLNINVFDSFEYILQLKADKILVTTGINKLQNAKIDALKIRDQFSEIYIDDVMSTNRIFKMGIFKKILIERKLKSQQVYIIGDNPNMELKAGHLLGMNTIQVCISNKKKQSKYANYIISSFKELIPILRKKDS